MRLLKYNFILTIFAFPILTFAQFGSSPVEYISTAQGLSHGTVLSIAQDNNGLMWLSTLNGFSRYDGYEFIPFKNEEAKGNALMLLTGKNGNIWMGYKDLLTSFDPITHEFENFPITGDENCKDGLIHLHEDSKNRLWAINKSYTCAYLLEDGKVKKVAIERKEYNLETPLFPLDSSKVWTSAAQNNKVFEFQITGNTPKVIIYDLKSSDEDLKFIRNTYFDNNKKLWIIASSAATAFPELFLYDNSKLNPYPLARRIRGITYLSEDKAGNIWIGGTTRLIKIDTENGTAVDFARQLPISWDFYGVNHLYEDKEGVLWASTQSGILKIASPKNAYDQYLNISEAGKSGIRVKGLLEDESGDIYIGSNNGLFKLDPASNLLERANIHSINPQTGLPYKLTDVSQMADASPHIWLVSNGQGFLKYHKNTKAISRVGANNKRNSKAISLLRDRDGIFWVGLMDGLMTYNPFSKTYNKYADRRINLHQEGIRFQHIVESKDKTLWLGSANGLYHIDKKKGVLGHYHADSTGASFPYRNIKSLYIDREGTIWLATNNGLGKFSPTTKATQTYTTENGLSDNSVMSIVPDGDSVLWVATKKGLNKFYLATNKFKAYYKKDQLTDDTFYPAAFLKTKNGKIYFGTNNGITAFHPKKKKPKELPPMLILTKYFKDSGGKGKLSEKIGALSNLKFIKLKPHNRFFGFTATLDDYSNPSGNRFMFKLEGYDKDWIDMGQQNSVRYTNIPAGSYTFKAKGMPVNGEWSEVLKVKVKVQQIFYKTWWFIALCLAAIAGLIYSFFNFRLGQLLKKERNRTGIAHSLNGEVKRFVKRLVKSSQDLKVENKQLFQQDLAYNASSALSMIGDVDWSYDRQPNKVADLLERMDSYLKEVLSPKNVEYELEVDKLNRNTTIDLKLRQNLYMIFKEGISNVARHSNASKVKVQLFNLNGRFNMIITDNGRVSQSYKKPGQGTNNIKARAKALDGDISIDNRNGYRITLRMDKFC